MGNRIMKFIGTKSCLSNYLLKTYSIKYQFIIFQTEQSVNLALDANPVKSSKIIHVQSAKPVLFIISLKLQNTIMSYNVIKFYFF